MSFESILRGAWLTSALALSLLVSAAAHATDGWVQPTTANDPESVWDFESDAFDGNGATYAQDTSNRVGDGAWLEFGLPAPIRTDRVRIQADFGYGAVDAVSVEVRSGDAWVPAFSGVVANAAPSDVTIAPQVISGLRFRFHYTTTGYWFWLYEISAYQLGDAIAPPTVATLAPTSVWPQAAVLHARVDAAGGEPAEVRFEYGTTTAYGQTTDWNPGHASGDTVAARVPSGLTSGVTWHVRAQARNSAGTVDGDDVAFTPGPVTTTSWMAPTTVVSSGWENPDGAFDDEPSTSARAFHDLYSAEWSPWLEAALPASRATGVRFAAARGAEVDGIQIDVHRDGAWQTVQNGDFADRSVTEAAFDAGLVDSVRARMHMRRPEVGQYWDLYQLQVRVDPTTATNQAPVVSAGPDVSGVVGSAIALAGSATDDGLPAGSTLAVGWDVVSGPGTVSFASASSASTTATFSAAGTYVVRLTAGDGALTASATATVTVVDVVTQLPAPVVSAWTWNGNAVDVYGTVPDGYAIASLNAQVTSPPATTATATLAPGLFHVTFDRGGATSATLALNFVDGVGTIGPVATTNFDFTGGGSGSGGDSTQLPPPTPGVTVTIVAGLTGDQTGTLNGEDVSFTKNASVSVQATASVGYGVISDLVLTTSDGQAIDLGGGSGSTLSTTTSVSFPAEGRIELTAEATVTNAGQSSSGMTAKPVILIVDRTPPRLNFILADRYRPTGSSPTDPPPPLRHGLTDDADLVLLNGNANADNAPLRDQRGMNVFDKAGFTLDAEVVDATGPSSGSLSGTAKAETAATKPLTVAIVRSATVDAPAVIEASGFAALDESIEYDSQYLTATTFRGRWTVGLDITDRAGNRLNADQLKAWVDTKPPSAQFGRIPYQQQFGNQGFANGQFGVGVSPARWIVTTADASEVWQDAVDDANSGAGGRASRRSCRSWRTKASSSPTPPAIRKTRFAATPRCCSRSTRRWGRGPAGSLRRIHCS